MTAPYYTDGDVTLHHGDALLIAQSLPSRSVQTIVTSPPYFGLRDYGHEAQLGAEATVGEYVANMVALFRELRRVLTDDGTLWLNLGDSYASTTKGSGGGPSATLGIRADGTNAMTDAGRERTLLKNRYESRKLETGLPDKNLIGVPWRVAFGLQDDGWILRSDIIWAKPNPMPESVTDRPTKAHEYLFLLAKQPRYYYDADAIAEPSAQRPSGDGFTRPQRTSGGLAAGNPDPWQPGTTRNRRDVWEISPVPFPGAHFAVYPPELIRPCILAGSRPGDTILDPFSGSGTTGMVANYEGRKYIGIDVNTDYLDLSLRTRFAAPVLNIWDDDEETA